MSLSSRSPSSVSRSQDSISLASFRSSFAVRRETRPISRRYIRTGSSITSTEFSISVVDGRFLSSSSGASSSSSSIVFIENPEGTGLFSSAKSSLLDSKFPGIANSRSNEPLNSSSFWESPFVSINQKLLSLSLNSFLNSSLVFNAFWSND